jgi:DNA-nicking Smr family endonuclease
MPVIFESLSDGFYTAFYEPNTDERKEKIEAWIKRSIPILQSSVEQELRKLFEDIIKDTWTQEGWKMRVKKFSDSKFMDTYQMELDISFRSHTSKSKYNIIEPLTEAIRAKTLEAAEAAKTAIIKLEPPTLIALKEIDLHDSRTVEKAIPLAEEFIRECYRENVRRIRIIHGKGIFVLQKAIREFLKNNKYIKSESIKAADRDHGGEGATEADLINFSSELID